MVLSLCCWGFLVVLTDSNQKIPSPPHLYDMTWGGYEGQLPLVPPRYERGCTHSSGPGLRRCEPHRVPRMRLGPGEVDRGFWRDCVSIEGPVIDAGPQASVLGHEEEAWGCRRGGRADKPLLKSLLDILLHCLVLRDGQGVHSTLGECGPRQQLDCAIPWLVRW